MSLQLNNTITLTGHGLATGDPVYYYATTNAIAGLSNSKVFYVIVVDANTIKLAKSSSNATTGQRISLTSAQAQILHNLFIKV